MPLLKLPNQSYRWLFAELLVVVVGILIAFQVEEWRTDRNDQEFARANLEAILLELEDENSDFEQAIPTSESALESTALLSELLISGQPREESALGQAFFDSLRGYGWQQNSPTYSGLRESGQLYLISDVELRDKLFDYYEFGEYVEILMTRLDESQDSFQKVAFQDFYRVPYVENSEETRAVRRRPHVVQPIEDIPRNPDFFGALGSLSARLSSLVTRMDDLQSRNLALQEFIRLRIVE